MSNFHLLAWQSSLNAATNENMSPVPDEIMTIQNDQFLPQNNWSALFAAGMGANLERMRFNNATFRQFTPPFLRPVNQAATPPTDPAVADYRRNPLTFRGLENLILEASNPNSGGAETVTAIAGVTQGGIVPSSGGQVYAMRGTATTAATAGRWTLLDVTWEDTLRTGSYHVMGLNHISTTGQAARVIFQDAVNRPGCLSQSAVGNRTHEMFRDGLGVWGTFDANRMPDIQVLCNAADASHELYLFFSPLAA